MDSDEMENQRKALRQRRRRSIRKKINGTSSRPRMAVFRSSRHVYVQVIDDASSTTLASAGTLGGQGAELCRGAKKIEQARKIGALIAERCKQHGIENVSFDRGGFKYHGRVRAIAEAAREAGLRL